MTNILFQSVDETLPAVHVQHIRRCVHTYAHRCMYIRKFSILTSELGSPKATFSNLMTVFKCCIASCGKPTTLVGEYIHMYVLYTWYNKHLCENDNPLCGYEHTHLKPVHLQIILAQVFQTFCCTFSKLQISQCLICTHHKFYNSVCVYMYVCTVHK